MAITITAARVDLDQGVRINNLRFGYVHGRDGGFYFTWHPTLDETIASIEADEIDGDGELDEDDVAEFLREYLPTTDPGRRWRD